MSHSAHPRIGIAQLLALALAAGAGAQEVLVPEPPDLNALAWRALSARDALARGEGALWLAATGVGEAYRDILAVARDGTGPASVRAIVAVGMLAPAGAEAFLAAVLADSGPGSEAGVAAAFALGLLPPTTPTPAVDAWLGGVHGSSYRRLRDALAALLASLGTRAHADKVTALLSLRDDQANRDAALRVLAERALAAAGMAPRPEAAFAALADRSAVLREQALLGMQAGWIRTDEQRAILRRIARADPVPEVRAAALAVLARVLDETALELGRRALAGPHPLEAAAGARVLLQLGGRALRPEVEARVLAPGVHTPVRAALLEAWPDPLPPAMVFACRDWLRAADSPPALRVAAGVALARGSAGTPDEPLLALFGTLTERDLLVSLAGALRGASALDRIVRHLAEECSPDAPAFADRLHALARVAPERATALLVRLASRHRLGDAALGRALAALRTARHPLLPASITALLPAVLREIRP